MILSRFILASLLLLCGCSTTPDLLSDSGDLSQADLVSIAYIQGLRRTQPMQITRNLSVRGRVVSSDFEMNFVKELFIQDATGAMAVELDDKKLFAQFRVGCEVEIRCKGLYVSSLKTDCRVGETNNQSGIVPISNSEIAKYVSVTDPDTQFVEPLDYNLKGFNVRQLGCLVMVRNVQFIDDERGLLWGDPNTDVLRTLVDRNSDTLRVMVRSTTLFSSYTLPDGSGEATGILVWERDQPCLKPYKETAFALYGPRF